MSKAGVDFEDFDHKGERFFVSVVGRNQVGILAGISSVLANAGASVDDISQNVADSSFSMNMVIHFESPLVNLDTVQEMLKDAAKEFDVKISLVSANF
ncbi:MAG: ACT domain-containing protein [Anaerotardibacter sp.]